MINKIEIVEIEKGVNLHLVKSDKFKTDLIGLYIKRPLKESEASKNAVLTRLLERGTKKYNTAQELNKRLDELYGAILVSDVHKYGEKHIFQFKMQVPDKRYVPTKTIFEDSIETLNELVNNPLVSENGFNKEFLKQEKKNLIQTIKAIKDDKVNYALHRCIESMCEDELYRISQNGSIEEIEKIDSDSLYKYYKKVLETSPIDICVIGNIDFEYVKKVVKEKLKFNRSEVIKIQREKIYKNIEKVKDIEEELSVEQGKLTLGYRTNIGYEEPSYEASVLAVSILGGGANSKLFNEIREEKSLSYYIYAKLEKYKSIMLITAGINSENKSEVIDLIKKNLTKIQEGKITKDELKIAKKSIVSSIESRSDYPNSFINYYYGQMLTNRIVELEEIVKKYKEISIEQIIEASKRFKLDTIHFIKSKEKVDNYES